MVDVTLTTDCVSAVDREEYWHEALGSTFAPVRLDGWRESTSPFARLRGAQIGRLLAAQITSTRQRHHRTERQIRQADAAYFQVGVLADGFARLHQDGRSAALTPGDLVVWENTRPFTWEFPGTWSISVLSIPADAVHLTQAERTALTAHTLAGTHGLTGVVARFLADLTRHADEIPDSHAEAVLMHTSDLAATMLRAATGVAPAHGSAEAVRERARQYIHSHWSDPGLSPREIAAAANVSVRYLHYLFESEPHSVAGYVRHLRLDAARRALLDPWHGGDSIAVIAHGCGFGDVSGFSRLFRETYGESPSQLRSRGTGTG